MAEMQSSPRPSADAGYPAAARQEGHDTTGQHDHTQETGKESRDPGTSASDPRERGGRRIL